MRAEESPLDVDVERVPQVARRVIRRDVEHLEVGDVVLDLGALVGDEPELLEDRGDLAHRLDARVERAAADRPAGRRDVDRLGGQAGLELAAAQRGAALGQRRLDGRADRVGDGADLRAVLGRQPADAAQDRRQSALLAEDVELERVERRGVRRSSDRASASRLQRLEVAGQVGEIHVFLGCYRLENHEPSIVAGSRVRGDQWFDR